jgi:AcrR family transcriptional regulator
MERFSARGFDGATMRDLAARLEITTAALYYHYTDKADILVQLIEPMLEDADRLTTSGEQDRPDIDHRLAGVLDLMLAHQAVFRLLSTDLSASRHPAIAERVQEVERRLFRLLAPERGDASRVRAVAVFGLLARPITALTDLDLTNHRDELLRAASAAYHAMELRVPVRAPRRSAPEAV